MTLATHIAEHELCHMFASAAATVALAPHLYDDLSFYIAASSDGGECAPTIDGLSTSDPLMVNIASLGALGPVCNLGDPPKLLRLFKTGAALSAADLSDRDHEMINKYRGPTTLPAIVVVATRGILVRGAVPALSQILIEMTSRDLNDTPCRAQDWVPRSVVEAELAVAKDLIDKALGIRTLKSGVRI